MKEFTPAQIQATREYLQMQQSFPSEVAEIGGRSFSFFILPEDLGQSVALKRPIRNFAFRMTSTPKTQTGERDVVLGVSRSVPSELRKYFALHEYVEFVEKGIDHRERCNSSEAEVLTQIPPDLREAYIDARIPLFEDLKGVFKEDIEVQRGNYTEEDLYEVTQTYEMLLARKEHRDRIPPGHFEAFLHK